MPFSLRQRELIAKHLFQDEVDGEQPTAIIEVTRRDLRFLLQAIQYYHDTCCPGEGKAESCEMLTWGEDIHTGAIVTSCAHQCQGWIDELLSDKVLANFPARSQSRT